MKLFYYWLCFCNHTNTTFFNPVGKKCECESCGVTTKVSKFDLQWKNSIIDGFALVTIQISLSLIQLGRCANVEIVAIKATLS